MEANPAGVLATYKQRIRHDLEARSAAAWRAKLAEEDPARMHLYACTEPRSAAAFFLGVDDMEAAGDADGWGAVRTGLVQNTVGNAGRGECCLCGEQGGGLGHIARTCPRLREARANFWLRASAGRREQLREAGEGTWAQAVFSLVADQQDLRASVMFGGAVARMLKEAAKS